MGLEYIVGIVAFYSILASLTITAAFFIAWFLLVYIPREVEKDQEEERKHDRQTQ